LLISTKMRKHFEDSIEIPEGVSCNINGKILNCTNNANSLALQLPIPKIRALIKEGRITLSVQKGNKNHWKLIKSYISHIKNLFSGLAKKYICTLEVCFVHFPITLKADPGVLMINNFLGEKAPRKAVILPDVFVEIKGQKITLSSSRKESVGQTAANFEIATKVRSRDRRIFQDGIFITKKPEAEK